MAIIVCPKCEKKHTVNLDTIKENAVPGKNIAARCKSCGHKFPVALDDLFTQDKEPAAESKSTLRRICVTLSKGGVGKTTTSVNLSAGLALAGYKVLLVDTDTQGQSSYILGTKPRAGLTELLTKELSPEECIIRARKNLWLLSGGKSLAGVKRIIDRKSFGAEWTMSEALKGLDHRYDYVIIDTAPGWDQLIVNVLFYATEVLVPVALEVMPLQGLAEFMKSLGSIQKYRKEIVLKYIVPTFMDTRVKGPEAIYTQLKKLYPEYICTPIRYSESLSEAPSYGKSIFEFAPGSTASADYRELVKKVTQDNKVALP
ncbi:MAG: AAA family ATPase [Desulfobacula sp.]|nr:AAA family ATPase [Desulfobacula sp.]